MCLFFRQCETKVTHLQQKPKPPAVAALVSALFVGGAVDFFKEGEHGIGISEPNFLEAWSNAFDKAIADLPAFQNAHKDGYLKPPPFATYDEWRAGFMGIFENIEKRLL